MHTSLSSALALLAISGLTLQAQTSQLINKETLPYFRFVLDKVANPDGTSAERSSREDVFATQLGLSKAQLAQVQSITLEYREELSKLRSRMREVESLAPVLSPIVADNAFRDLCTERDVLVERLAKKLLNHLGTETAQHLIPTKHQ